MLDLTRLCFVAPLCKVGFVPPGRDPPELAISREHPLIIDQDGLKDFRPQYPNAAYRWDRSTVHSSGASLTLLDGHVARVAFKKLWRIYRAGNVVHSFWCIED